MRTADRRDTSRTRETRALALAPGDQDTLRLVARVAWMYHVRNLKQSEVADALGLSQSRVSRLLDTATSLGISAPLSASPPASTSTSSTHCWRRTACAACTCSTCRP